MEQWQQLREYEERQRQQRSIREQEIAEQKRREAQQAQELQIAREKQRRLTQQRQEELRQIERLETEKQRALNEQKYLASLARSAEELRISNQQSQEVHRELQKQIAEQQAKRPDPPYDTFMEQFFHEGWRKAYPSIEIVPQHHIGRFRVDFAHLATMTAIELDGGIHRERHVWQRGYPRQRYLRSQGWDVIYFTNSEVWFHLDSCIQQVFAVFLERQGR